MNKLFISQNTTRNITKENNAKLYYYGPDHLNGNSKSTTRVLFGVFLIMDCLIMKILKNIFRSRLLLTI